MGLGLNVGLMKSALIGWVERREMGALTLIDVLMLLLIEAPVNSCINDDDIL